MDRVHIGTGEEKRRMNQHSFSKLNQGGHFLLPLMDFLNQWDANRIPPLHIWCMRVWECWDFHACLGREFNLRPSRVPLVRPSVSSGTLQGNIIRAHTHPAECLRVGMEFTTIHAPAESKKIYLLLQLTQWPFSCSLAPERILRASRTLSSLALSLSGGSLWGISRVHKKRWLWEERHKTENGGVVIHA